MRPYFSRGECPRGRVPRRPELGCGVDTERTHNICWVQQGLARDWLFSPGPSCQAIFSGAVGVLPARGSYPPRSANIAAAVAKEAVCVISGRCSGGQWSGLAGAESEMFRADHATDWSGGGLKLRSQRPKGGIGKSLAIFWRLENCKSLAANLRLEGLGESRNWES